MTEISTATTVAELVVDRPSRARLFEQLGLDYCCGGRQPLGEACTNRGLNPDAVLALLDAERTLNGSPVVDWSHVSIPELCDHIESTHHAYLRRELPRISTLWEKVERSHGADLPSVREVRETYERLRAELEGHCDEEERSTFPACRRLAAGIPLDATVTTELTMLEAEHVHAGALLARLAVLTASYDTDAALCNTHRAALASLEDLERDLHEHIHEENNVLFPRAVANSAL